MTYINLSTMCNRNKVKKIKTNLGLIKHKVPQALILALFQFSVFVYDSCNNLL